MGVNCLRVRWPNKPIKVAPRLQRGRRGAVHRACTRMRELNLLSPRTLSWALITCCVPSQQGGDAQ